MRILSGKVRRRLPSFIYNTILFIRYICFRNCCDNQTQSRIAYPDGSWVKCKSTADLERIDNFLCRAVKVSPLSILQIGIGNSSLFASIGSKTSRFVGITVVEDEIIHSKEKFPKDFGDRYDVRLIDKYSSDLLMIKGTFDIIVDNNISSYACCHYHFDKMLDNYRNLLKPNGSILIGIDGIKYFNFGFGLTISMLNRLAKSHGLIHKEGIESHLLEHSWPHCDPT